MRTNLTKETIFNLYKCKEVLKNSNVELYEELFKMFDEDLEKLKSDTKVSGDWNYLLLILLFKYGKITAKDVFKIIFPNEISIKTNGNYNTISNRLTKLFKDGVCYRISHLSEENRQYYEYHLNYENKDFETGKITDRIFEFIKTHDTFTLKQLREFIYPNEIDILTPENIKSRIYVQMYSLIRGRNLEVYKFPNIKNSDEKVYYTNKNFKQEYLESYYNKHILNL